MIQWMASHLCIYGKLKLNCGGRERKEGLAERGEVKVGGW